MPFFQIPREAFNEANLKGPKKRGFGEHKEVFDHLESGIVFFLGEDSDRVITLRKEGHLLRAHCFDKAVGGDLVKFYGLNQVG